MFLFGKCENSCKGCNLANSSRDYKTVLERTKEFMLENREAIQVTKEMGKVYIALESSGIVTSNKRVIFSKEFKEFFNFLGEEFSHIDIQLQNLDNIVYDKKTKYILDYLEVLMQDYKNLDFLLCSPLIKKGLRHSNRTTLYGGYLLGTRKREGEFLIEGTRTNNSKDLALNYYESDLSCNSNQITKANEFMMTQLREYSNVYELDKKDCFFALIDESSYHITHSIYHTAKYLGSIPMKSSVEETTNEWLNKYGHYLDILKVKERKEDE